MKLITFTLYSALTIMMIGCAGSIKFTANRVEWNREYGLCLAAPAGTWNVTGNCFDRNWGAGIYANRISNSTFTGNTFRINGKDSSQLLEGPEESCHMLFQSCRGISVTGNTGAAGIDRVPRGEPSPDYAFWLKDIACSFITTNAFAHGYVKDMLADKGGNKTDLFINNVGSVFEINS